MSCSGSVGQRSRWVVQGHDTRRLDRHEMTLPLLQTWPLYLLPFLLLCLSLFQFSSPSIAHFYLSFLSYTLVSCSSLLFYAVCFLSSFHYSLLVSFLEVFNFYTGFFSSDPLSLSCLLTHPLLITVNLQISNTHPLKKAIPIYPLFHRFLLYHFHLNLPAILPHHIHNFPFPHHSTSSVLPPNPSTIHPLLYPPSLFSLSVASILTLNTSLPILAIPMHILSCSIRPKPPALLWSSQCPSAAKGRCHLVSGAENRSAAIRCSA